MLVFGSEVLCLYGRFSETVFLYLRASLVVQRLKHLPAMWETWVRSLGQEDPLEKEMATHSSILAWRIPWTEELGELQSTGRKESDTTERLHIHSFIQVTPGGGNGTPLQCSCLENPMDGQSWWAAVPGVAKSRAGTTEQLHFQSCLILSDEGIWVKNNHSMNFEFSVLGFSVVLTLYIRNFM